MTAGTPVCQICIAKTMRNYYHYTYKENKPHIGSRVLVSFRKKPKIGIVVGYGISQINPSKILPIENILDDLPLLDKTFFDLANWVAYYYQAPLSEVIATALPKQFRLGKSIETCLEKVYRLSMDSVHVKLHIDKRKKKLLQLVDFLEETQHPISEATLRRKGFKKQSWEFLQEKGLLLENKILLPPIHHWEEKTNPKLNLQQLQAVDALVTQLDRYQCFLLQGVTGSGKTEVYQQVIKQVMAQGKQVLLLVPEIGLTPQLFARFQRRFKEPMVMIHSQLNDSERFRAWVLAREGNVSLIIGTRSALFTPLPNLGLIVLDEEHDISFKQIKGVRYSARDSAIYRASLANIPVILGSATPSLESLQNVESGKYKRLLLTQKAVGSNPVHYQFIDLRRNRQDHSLADPTLSIMKKHLEAGNQILLFLNRRGFAPIILCHDCGWIADCPNCDNHLNFHRQDERYHCHLCNYQRRPFIQCQACQNTKLIAVGTGTQRLEPFLAQTFPDYPVLRIDRDQVRKKGEWSKKLTQIEEQSVKIIVGTQMLAKGHDFHNITCVVIIDADTGLLQVDFRAVERLGQLLVQVSGRAGRGQKSGEVVIQTHQPQHPLLNLLIQSGYDKFAHELLKKRCQAKLPPFAHLALIQAKAKNTSVINAFLHKIRQWLSAYSIQCLGPIPAQVARKANEYHHQLLLKSDNRTQLQQILTHLRNWLTISKAGAGVRWSIDRDPQDIL